MMQKYTTDLFFNGRITCKQPLEGFRAGTDSVFLAASINPAHGTKILEMGCAAAVASCCLLYRCPSVQLDGVEIIHNYKQYARDNVIYNGFDTRFNFIHADITEKVSQLNALGLRSDYYDQIFANPPYFVSHESRPLKDSLKEKAHKRQANELSIWLSRIVSFLHANGVLTLIIPTHSLSELIGAMQKYSCGAIKILPIYTDYNKPARRLIIQAQKGRKPESTMLPPLYVHKKDRFYRKACRQILGDAMYIDLK